MQGNYRSNPDAPFRGNIRGGTEKNHGKPSEQSASGPRSESKTSLCILTHYLLHIANMETVRSFVIQ
jgi:hypothetical protein